jgi:hypothetical protein
MMAEGRWPSGRTVIPGIIDTKSPVLEPPELLDRRSTSGLSMQDGVRLGCPLIAD